MRCWIFGLMVAVAISRVAWGEVEFRPLAYVGMPIEGGVAESVPAWAFDINHFGQTVLRINVAQPDGSGRYQGVWVHDGSGLQVVARAGKTSPVFGDQFSSLRDLVEIGDGGDVAFIAQEHSGFRYLWSGQAGVFRTIVSDLQVGASVEYLRVQPDGQVLVYQGYEKYIASLGRFPGPQLIATDGMAATGTEKVFGFVAQPSINRSNQIALSGSFEPFPPQQTNASGGVWSWDRTNGLKLVLSDGMPAPESGGELFELNGFERPKIGPDGTIYFTAPTRHPQTRHQSFGLWAAERDAGIRPVMFAPSVDLGGTFIEPPEISSDGRLLFWTREYGDFGSRGHRLWTYHGDVLREVTLPEGFLRNDPFLAINAQGLSLFSVVDSEGRTNFWMGGPARSPEFVIRTGDTLQLGDVVKTIQHLRFDSDDLNDRNEWVFQAYFTDGTTATMLAVLPEPSFGVLAVVLGLVGMGRRRRS